MWRDRKWVEAIEGIDRALELMEKHEYAEARDIFLSLREQQGSEKRSAFIAYQLAIASDYLEEYERAMAFIEEAIAADPMCSYFHRSFDVITNRIRRALASEDLPPTEASTPRLYELLIESGQGDAASHLAMARYLLATDKPQEARRIVDALVTLDPRNRGAWTVMKNVAEALGDAELAARADLEVRSLPAGRRELFAVSGRAEA